MPSLVTISLLLLLGTAEAVDSRRELLGGKKNKGKNANKITNMTKPTVVPGQEKKSRFEDFKKRFGRSYGTPEEEQARFAEFSKMDDKLQTLQANSGSTATFGHSRFSDMTAEERGRLANANFGPDPAAGHHRRALSSADDFAGAGRELLQTSNLAASVDWSSYFPPAKDQGQCGSCYAFSTAAQIAAAITIAYNLPVGTQTTSEEFILECTRPTGAGCQGGDPLSVITSLNTNFGGVWPYSARPYTQYATTTGATPACPAPKANNRTLGTGTYPSGAAFWTSQAGSYASNETQLMIQLQTGPVVVGIDAEDSLFLYSSGIYNVDCTDTTTAAQAKGPIPQSLLNHAVVVVGYGTDASGNAFWKIRNSWGPTFGENGYFRFKRNAYPGRGNAAGGMCGIGFTYARAVVVKGNVSPPPAPPPLPSPPTPPSPPSLAALKPGYVNVPCGSSTVSMVYLTGCKNYPALCGSYLATGRTCPGSTGGPAAQIFALSPVPTSYGGSKPELWFLASNGAWIVGPAAYECKAYVLGAPEYTMGYFPSSNLSYIEGYTFTDGAGAICGTAAASG